MLQKLRPAIQLALAGDLPDPWKSLAFGGFPMANFFDTAVHQNSTNNFLRVLTRPRTVEDQSQVTPNSSPALRPPLRRISAENASNSSAQLRCCRCWVPRQKIESWTGQEVETICSIQPYPFTIFLQSTWTEPHALSQKFVWNQCAFVA